MTTSLLINAHVNLVDEFHTANRHLSSFEFVLIQPILLKEVWITPLSAPEHSRVLRNSNNTIQPMFFVDLLYFFQSNFFAS